MKPPPEPVSLSSQQIAELLNHLSDTRHDVNNALSLIAAAAELIRMNPTMAAKMITTLAEQPPRIAAGLQAFSGHLERSLGTRKP